METCGINYDFQKVSTDLSAKLSARKIIDLHEELQSTFTVYIRSLFKEAIEKI